MRKIIMVICFFGITNAYCQSFGEPTKQLSVQEANKMNGTASPTINGIPYSQYKAQQGALKQGSTVVPVNTSTVASGITGKGVQAPVSNVSSVKLSATDNPTSAKGQSTSAAIPTAMTVVPAAKTAVTQTDVQAPATQTIPVGSLKSSPLTPTPVGAAPIASKTIVPTTNGGPLVPMPSVNLATGSDAQVAGTVSQNKMPEQVNGQPKAGVVVETAPSVINAAKAAGKHN